MINPISWMNRLFPIMLMADGDDGGGGDGDTAWRDTFPEPVREWDEFKNSDSPEKFWGQVGEMRSHLGQSIRVPTEEAGDEQWSQFYTKLQTKVPGLMPKPNMEDETAMQTLYRQMGQPEKAEEYKIPEIDTQGVELQADTAEAFRAVAHKHGLTQKQFEGVVTDFTALNVNAGLEMRKAAQTDQASLQTEWGAAYDQNTGLVKSLAIKTNAPESLLKAIEHKQVDASTMKWMHKIATQFGGSEGVNLLNDDGGDQGLVMTPAEAQEKINDMMNNKDHAYWDGSHSQHEQAVKRMLELQKFANPTASTNVNDLRRGAGSAT